MRSVSASRPSLVPSREDDPGFGYFEISENQPDGKTKIFRIKESVTVVGREQGCGIRVNDPRVSRLHCKFIAEKNSSGNTELKVSCMKERCKIIVDGESVSVEGKVIHDGSVIRIVNASIRWHSQNPMLMFSPPPNNDTEMEREVFKTPSGLFGTPTRQFQRIASSRRESKSMVTVRETAVTSTPQQSERRQTKHGLEISSVSICDSTRATFGSADSSFDRAYNVTNPSDVEYHSFTSYEEGDSQSSIASLSPVKPNASVLESPKTVHQDAVSTPENQVRRTARQIKTPISHSLRTKRDDSEVENGDVSIPALFFETPAKQMEKAPVTEEAILEIHQATASAKRPSARISTRGESLVSPDKQNVSVLESPMPLNKDAVSETENQVRRTPRQVKTPISQSLKTKGEDSEGGNGDASNPAHLSQTPASKVENGDVSITSELFKTPAKKEDDGDISISDQLYRPAKKVEDADVSIPLALFKTPAKNIVNADVSIPALFFETPAKEVENVPITEEAVPKAHQVTSSTERPSAKVSTPAGRFVSPAKKNISVLESPKPSNKDAVSTPENQVRRTARQIKTPISQSLKTKSVDSEVEIGDVSIPAGLFKTPSKKVGNGDVSTPAMLYETPAKEVETVLVTEEAVPETQKTPASVKRPSARISTRGGNLISPAKQNISVLESPKPLSKDAIGATENQVRRTPRQIKTPISQSLTTKNEDSEIENGDVSIPARLFKTPAKKVEDADVSIPAELFKTPAKKVEDADVFIPAVLFKTPAKKIEDADVSIPAVLFKTPEKKIEDADVSIPAVLFKTPAKKAEDADVSIPAVLFKTPSTEKVPGTEYTIFSEADTAIASTRRPSARISTRGGNLVSPAKQNVSALESPKPLTKDAVSATENHVRRTPRQTKTPISQSLKTKSEDSDIDNGDVSFTAHLFQTPAKNVEDAEVSIPAELLKTPAKKVKDPNVSIPSELVKTPAKKVVDADVSIPGQFFGTPAKEVEKVAVTEEEIPETHQASHKRSSARNSTRRESLVSPAKQNVSVLESAKPMVKHTVSISATETQVRRTPRQIKSATPQSVKTKSEDSEIENGDFSNATHLLQTPAKKAEDAAVSTPPVVFKTPAKKVEDADVSIPAMFFKTPAKEVGNVLVNEEATSKKHQNSASVTRTRISTRVGNLVSPAKQNVSVLESPKPLNKDAVGELENQVRRTPRQIKTSISQSLKTESEGSEVENGDVSIPVGLFKTPAKKAEDADVSIPAALLKTPSLEKVPVTEYAISERDAATASTRRPSARISTRGGSVASPAKQNVSVLESPKPMNKDAVSETESQVRRTPRQIKTPISQSLKTKGLDSEVEIGDVSIPALLFETPSKEVEKLLETEEANRELLQATASGKRPSARTSTRVGSLVSPAKQNVSVLESPMPLNKDAVSAADNQVRRTPRQTKASNSHFLKAKVEGSEVEKGDVSIPALFFETPAKEVEKVLVTKEAIPETHPKATASIKKPSDRISTREESLVSPDKQNVSVLESPKQNPEDSTHTKRGRSASDSETEEETISETSKAAAGTSKWGGRKADVLVEVSVSRKLRKIAVEPVEHTPSSPRPRRGRNASPTEKDREATPHTKRPPAGKSKRGGRKVEVELEEPVSKKLGKVLVEPEEPTPSSRPKRGRSATPAQTEDEEETSKTKRTAAGNSKREGRKPEVVEEVSVSKKLRKMLVESDEPIPSSPRPRREKTAPLSQTENNEATPKTKRPAAGTSKRGGKKTELVGEPVSQELTKIVVETEEPIPSPRPRRGKGRNAPPAETEDNGATPSKGPAAGTSKRGGRKAEVLEEQVSQELRKIVVDTEEPIQSSLPRRGRNALPTQTEDKVATPKTKRPAAGNSRRGGRNAELVEEPVSQELRKMIVEQEEPTHSSPLPRRGRNAPPAKKEDKEATPSAKKPAAGNSKRGGIKAEVVVEVAVSRKLTKMLVEPEEPIPSSSRPRRGRNATPSQTEDEEETSKTKRPDALTSKRGAKKAQVEEPVSKKLRKIAVEPVEHTQSSPRPRRGRNASPTEKDREATPHTKRPPAGKSKRGGRKVEVVVEEPVSKKLGKVLVEPEEPTPSSRPKRGRSATPAQTEDEEETSKSKRPAAGNSKRGGKKTELVEEPGSQELRNIVVETEEPISSSRPRRGKGRNAPPAEIEDNGAAQSKRPAPAAGTSKRGGRKAEVVEEAVSQELRKIAVEPVEHTPSSPRPRRGRNASPTEKDREATPHTKRPAAGKSKRGGRKVEVELEEPVSKKLGKMLVEAEEPTPSARPKRRGRKVESTDEVEPAVGRVTRRAAKKW